MIELHEVAGDVEWPSHNAEDSARQRQAILTKPRGALGRLEDLAEWISGAQGECPPHDFRRARLVIFAGDHGIASAGVSAYPPEVTAQMVANFIAGGAAANVLAEAAGATVRVVDIAVDGDTDPEVARFKVRRSSGLIDREDALSEEEVLAAIDAGIRIADEEIDGGADLLIAGDMGIGNTTPAATIISAITNTEPIKVVGRGTGIDDDGWMRKATAIRDARRRAWPVRWNPVELLRTAGGADLAAMAGFLLRAAARKTPVVLDGVVVTSVALVVHEMQPRATRWWQAGHLSPEPSHQMALTRMGLLPILDLGMRLGEGSGALVALPVLRAAVRTLADMATFEEAGVSTEAGGESTPTAEPVEVAASAAEPAGAEAEVTAPVAEAVAEPEAEAVAEPERAAVAEPEAAQPPA